jgi:hypothetical protein
VAGETARDPQLAERAVGVADEEPGDDRLADAAATAPDVEALRAREEQDPDSRAAERVADGVQRGPLAVLEPSARECVAADGPFRRG